MNRTRTGVVAVRCRRRQVLAGAVVAVTGVVLPVVAVRARESCRGWCLRHCDDTCRDGDRPACPSRRG